MDKQKFTNELKQVFDYIHNSLLKEYDTDKISTEYFIVSVLENDSTVANKILSKVTLHDNMENAKSHFYQWLSQNARSFGSAKEYDELFELTIKDARSLANRQKSKNINSGHVLASIFKDNAEVGNYFKTLGVTLGQVMTQVEQESQETAEKVEDTDESKPFKHVRKKQKKAKQAEDVRVERIVYDIPSSHGTKQTERLFRNLNLMSGIGKIEEVCGHEDIYEKIFSTLSKKYKNNVVLVGPSGVGKTAIARNIANLIVREQVPASFRKKKLLNVDFNSLFSDTSMRGMFEARMKAILTDAMQDDSEYIFLIDSMDTALNTKLNDNGIEDFIETVMKEKDIMLICTCSEKGYAKEIGDNPQWARYFEKIVVSEPSEEACVEILKKHTEGLEYFHNVKYDDDTLSVCTKLSKRYISERSLPDSAIDILDRAGARKSLEEKEPDDVRSARENLRKLRERIDAKKRLVTDKDYDEIEGLEKREIELQGVLNYALKCYNLNKQPQTVTANDIRQCVSEKTGIPLTDLTVDDREKLKNLDVRIKDIVIGQEEAVDTVCRAIRRQRIGISNPDKPVVFLMAGSTGVGKSYLAKTLAREVFGDEKKFVRLDMAEYADKTAVNKVIGASAGYVGYDNGGQLTEAIKKHKNCVLLLDEIEKADEEVHNIFLSMFDEGRLTDNKGVFVDCRNVIIIMTSNVGAREVDERGNGMGFVTNRDEMKRSIIEKELKRKFKPEFINRIDKIVYFNKLTEEDIRKIISLEIGKVEKRLEGIHYYIGDTLREKLTDKIYGNIDFKKNMGARPVIREIQNVLEDRITDLIIDGNIEENHVFTPEEFFSEEK